MRPYSVLYDIWLKLPKSLWCHAVIQRIRNSIRPPTAHHDDIYTAKYFAKTIDRAAMHAAPIVAKSILDDLGPQRVIDMGCGTGALLKALQDKGCTCLGIEYAEAALEICRSRGLDVIQFDIERDTLELCVEPFDVAISIEVAEHLAESCAKRYVGSLSSLAPTIVFAAATPGQGGKGHINEQPHEYWIELIGAHGFALDRVLSERWRSQWKREGLAH